MPRKNLTLPLQVFDGGPPLVAHDVGLGGLFVTTAQPRWPGRLLRVRFVLPRQRRAIRATCRVVELVPEACGVGLSLCFLKLAPAAQTAITRFVEEEALNPAQKQPLPSYHELGIAARIDAWVARIADDCRRLKAQMLA